MKRALVTGGGGFIGSNLVDALASGGIEVVVLDDFRTGRREFLEAAVSTGLVDVVEGDILDPVTLDRACEGCDAVFHLQANADVRHGLEAPTRDLEQNTVATSRVLEAMRAHGIKFIGFSSTGSVYGEPEVFPTPENAPFPEQTSLYGASKLACEGLIAAYCSGYDFTGIVFRFVSILGERYTHGHVIDFYRSLQDDPATLQVLGDGTQEKSYLYVGDCVRAILLASEAVAGKPGFYVFNLGHSETVTVNQSIENICEVLDVDPALSYSGGPRGWIGDSPLIRLDTTRIESLGWAPQLSIRDATRQTIDWFRGNPELLRSHEDGRAAKTS